MTTWNDINKAVPAVPGIYWTKSEYGASKPTLTYYFGHHGGWGHLDGIDESQSHIEVRGTLTPDFWAPVEPPEN